MQLFGGALEADIPRGFTDASQFRDVPDEQEMFVGNIEGCDSGFIVDLCEEVMPDKSIEEAFHYHIKDVHEMSKTPLEDVDTRMTSKSTANGHTYVFELQEINRTSKCKLFLMFALFRIPEHKTDVFITQSVELSKEPGTINSAFLGSLENQATLNIAKFINTFKVNDPSLFKN